MLLVLRGEATFAEWLEWFVRIESDNKAHRGAIAFHLYDYQRDRVVAWEAGQSEVILKARQLGFSWLAAAFAVWTAAYHESSHVGVFSKSAFEMKRLIRKMRFIVKRLPPELRNGAVMTTESIVFANESTISGFPSTEDAGIGETNRLVIFDEWAFHPYGEANLAAVLPTVAAGGQIIAMSTADPALGVGGHFYETYKLAESGGNGLVAVFVPWNARPTRDEAFYASQKVLHAGNPQRFQAFYPATADEAFVGREGLVYPMFERSRHIVPGAPPVPWEDCWEHRYAFDLGGGDPTALLVGGTYRRQGEDYSRLHIYGMLYRDTGAPSPEELYAYLGPWGDRWTQGEGDPAPGGAVMAEGMRRAGYPCRRGHSSRDDIAGTVSMYLERGWVTFAPDLEPLFREFASYRWKPQTDPNSRERYATKTPQDHHGDALDALRLMVVGLYRDEGGASGAFEEVFSEVTL